jgi:hypothetical protein
MKTLRLGTRALALYACVFLFSPSAAFAATLSFTPSAGEFVAGKNFTVKVSIDPGTDKVNAADGTVSFDSSVLSVASVSKDGSAFSLWTADPSFSNTDGTVVFSGGTPTAFSNKGTVVSIVFKAKKPGSAAVSFSKGSILAADGKGSDVYTPGESATFVITDAPAAPPPPAAEPEATSEAIGTLPIAPVITSSTHGKPENWYGTSTALFAWKPTNDVLSVRTVFSQNPEDKPTQVLPLASTTQMVAGIADGEWYFIAQYKNDSGWGPMGKLQIHVDTTPPSEFDVALASPSSATDVPKLSFKAEDALSGVDRYEILFNGTAAGSVKAKDIPDGLFVIPPQEGGDTEVKIKASDKAGNMREAVRRLTLPKVEKPVAEGDAPKQSSNWIEHALVVLLALLLGGAVAWNMRLRKDRYTEQARILVRVVEVREKNDRIFTAMREEFEQMVQDFDEKPQLTPQERDLLEGIKEVLEISEGLLDSSLEELKKEVRGK